MEKRQGQFRILIVDDEPQLLRMMKAYLERLGYSLATAETTEQASALAAQQDFDVVVIDGTMPGLSLDNLGREILVGNESASVLATSGYPVDVSALEAAAPGRVAFLHKPFTPEMLAAALRRMLGAEKQEEV
ncbi:MAG: hypothetical protein C5B51_04965 [Terriglobia bacterium]|nr:MAG: hypothetical protein C5B51_04965 [Terriglobia bacterium]